MQEEAQASNPRGGVTAPSPTGLPFNVQTHFAWLRTALSADRTLMAWNRTSLALIAFGFTIYQFFENIEQAAGGAGRPQAPRNLGLALIAVGTLGTLVALFQYWHVRKYLQGEEFQPNGMREGLPGRSLTLVVATFSAIIGIITLGWIAARG